MSIHKSEELHTVACASSHLSAFRSGPLTGTIEAPGDKSMSHRALILGGLASGQTLISGMLEGEDVLHTAKAIATLGASVERVAPGNWLVEGRNWRSPQQLIDCGNSGTGVRLLMGAVAGLPIRATFTGDQSLSRRPMERVLQPLRRMGARCEQSSLPITIEGGGLGGICFLNEQASAQVKSAILLAGLRASGEVTVVEPLPTRDHTENMLRAFGCEVDVVDHEVRLGRNRALRGTEIQIAGDPSSAAFPIVAALVIPGSKVTLRNVMVNPRRTGLFTTLREMGAHLEIKNVREAGGEKFADLTAAYSPLAGIEVPAARAPSMIDEYPILAVAAAFARGTSVMHGVGELRVKESNRLAAIVAGLRQCGVEAREEADSLVVEGGGAIARGGGDVDARDDHRIAMSFLIFGLAAQTPVRVNGAQMISTSFPGFATLMRSLEATIA